jgi:hypothetical protein
MRLKSGEVQSFYCEASLQRIQPFEEPLPHNLRSPNRADLGFYDPEGTASAGYAMRFLLFARSCAFKHLKPFTNGGIVPTENKAMRLNADHELHSNRHIYCT